MTTLNVFLSDDMRAFIESEMTQRGHARQELEEKLIEGLASGPATPMTREDWDDLERRVWDRHPNAHPQTRITLLDDTAQR